MLSLYEILKASKTGIAPDMWTALAGANFGGAGSGVETKEITGIPPLSIRSNGTMLLDYLISGNTVQNGTPSPDSPIQPQETGERTGNLLPFDDKNFVITVGNSNLTVECKNGNLFFQGNAGEISSSQVVWKNNFAFELEAGTYYCNFPAPLRQGFGRYIRKYDDDAIILTSANYTFTLSEKTKCYLSFYIYQKTIDTKIELMLNTGSTAKPYEPYGYKIPILSANTTTPVYLGEVQTTRRIRKLVLDGTENWIVETGPAGMYSLPGITPLVQYVNQLCTHFLLASSYSEFYYNDLRFCVANRPTLLIHYNACQTVSKFKAFLAAEYAAGHPVIIWYVLPTSQTAVVNEPLRKIGDYADTLSYEQAGVQIPTNRGNTVIDVMTELKPSQMYIKYQK